MRPAIWAAGSGCCRCVGISPRRSLIFSRLMQFLKQFRRAAGPYVAVAFAGALLLVVAAEHTDAHKPVTSKYDYNRDVFPLLQDHCASCHVQGGPAPMSLMTYDAAVPWA